MGSNLKGQLMSHEAIPYLAIIISLAIILVRLNMFSADSFENKVTMNICQITVYAAPFMLLYLTDLHCSNNC